MTWSRGRVCFLLVLCCGLALPGLLGPADPVAAEALWGWAEETSGGDLAHPAYVDATESAAALRPWHPGYAEARAHIEVVGRARLEAR